MAGVGAGYSVYGVLLLVWFFAVGTSPHRLSRHGTDQ
jgi:hypothetical protein